MRCLYLAGSLLLLAQPMLAQFNMYPAVSSELLATALNISSGCLAALNATVGCDEDLFQMAGSADAYFWSDDNATALCTSQCLSSAASWWDQTADACEDDQLNAYGRVYPAQTVPGRFLDGLNIVCLTADTDVTQDVGINGTLITFTDVGGYNSTVNSTFADLESLPDTPLGRRQSSSSPSSAYCLVQSYDWVGSDIIRPDCDDPANANASQCLDPTDVPAENSRIANLYPDSLLCSTCFLKMFYLRLASPYLPDADNSDDMVAQWFDILDVCNANSTMPELIVRLLPYYPAAPGFSIDGAINATDFVMPAVDSTCAGRLLSLASLPEPNLDYDTQTPCDVIPPALNASTGDVIQTMGTAVCLPDFNVTEICLPLSCQVGLMPNSTTCDEFATSISTSNTTVTKTQFLTWNPNLLGLCSNTTEQYVCVGAPGGTYIPPYVANSTTDTGSQQRGGGGGSSTGSGGVDGSGLNSTYIQPGGTAPSPTQSGIPATCTRFAEVGAGDGCSSFASAFGLTLEAFTSWNPVLGVDGANCSTMLWTGYYYCLGVAGSSTATATATGTGTGTGTTSTGVSSTVPTPSPVQSGIDPQCTKYAEAMSGEYCSEFAPEYGITTAQLYAWNPILGTDGANCGTLFQANVYYCVGAPAASSVASSTSAPTHTSVSAPGPTQSGITASCDKYAEAVSGDLCGTFASKNGITTAQLYAWNPVLGANGENCGSDLWAQEYYCVGVWS